MEEPLGVLSADLANKHIASSTTLIVELEVLVALRIDSETIPVFLNDRVWSRAVISS